MLKRLQARATINRWLSPDHAIGRGLISARIKGQLVRWRPRRDEDRRLKQAVARLAPRFTMVDLPRLRQLAALAGEVHARQLAGCVVECGTWKGGSLALMDWVLRQHHDRRELWGFDSFAGLPRPTGRDQAEVEQSFFQGWCRAAASDVVEAFAAAGGTRDGVHIVGGWLDQTLRGSETGPIALLNVDVDWYESVKVALDVLYDRVVSGGIVSIDDYGRWPGCDAAVNEFLSARGRARSILTRTGPYGAWFTKP